MTQLSIAAALVVALLTAVFLIGSGGAAHYGVSVFVGAPLALAGLTFAMLWRVGREGPSPSTTHQYPVNAPAAPPKRSGELVAKLEARGYQIAAVTVTETGEDGGVLGSEAPLVGTAFCLRDRRAGPEGGVVVRLHPGESDGLRGLVEAIDTGPGLYDEMAQYAVVALGELVPGLEFQALGREPGWRAAATLLADLPAPPLGLQLL